MGAYILWKRDTTAGMPEVVSTDPWTDCQQTDSRALTVAGCTALIEQGETDPRKLADAHLFRGRAHATLSHLAEARADYGYSIQLLNANPVALEERGTLSEFESRYEVALADFELALTQANALSELTPGQTWLDLLNRLQRSVPRLRRRVDLEVHWRSYLANIQQQNDYSNWPGPPSDLYWRHHEQP